MFHVVNATAVRLTWSGSVHLSTCIQYTIICNDTGIIIGQYEKVFPPELISTDWVLDDDVTFMDVYIHNFTLYYFIPNNVFPLLTTVITFNFGKIIPNILSKYKVSWFLDKKDFQIQFGPFHYGLDWGVSHSIAIISFIIPKPRRVNNFRYKAWLERKCAMEIMQWKYPAWNRAVEVNCRQAARNVLPSQTLKPSYLCVLYLLSYTPLASSFRLCDTVTLWWVFHRPICRAPPTVTL